MSDSNKTVEKPIGEGQPIISDEDKETSGSRKKKPWQWAVDAIVWVACVVALSWVLLTPSQNSSFLKYIIKDLEKGTDGAGFITDSTDYSYEEHEEP